MAATLNGNRADAAAGFMPPAYKTDTLGEPETMRRSELLRLSVQVLATMQLCLGSATAAPALSSRFFSESSSLLQLVTHLLRPRRTDDDAVERWHLGPHRLEAFVRGREDKMVKEVYQAVGAIVPFIPPMLGWDNWDKRKSDRILTEGESNVTGGALVSLRREVEVSPFVVCMCFAAGLGERQSSG